MNSIIAQSTQRTKENAEAKAKEKQASDKLSKSIDKRKPGLDRKTHATTRVQQTAEAKEIANANLVKKERAAPTGTGGPSTHVLRTRADCRRRVGRTSPACASYVYRPKGKAMILVALPNAGSCNGRFVAIYTRTALFFGWVPRGGRRLPTWR